MKPKLLTLTLLLLNVLSAFGQPLFDSEKMQELSLQGNFDSTFHIAKQLLKDENLGLEASLFCFRAYRDKHKGKATRRIAENNLKKFKATASPYNLIRLLLNLAEAKLLLWETEGVDKGLKEAKKMMTALSQKPSFLWSYLEYLEGLQLSNDFGMNHPGVEKAYLAALAGLDSLEGVSPKIKGKLLRDIGNINRTIGALEKSGDYYRQAFHLYQKHFPPGHFLIGAAHYSQGNVYYELMEYQKALDEYLPAYSIWESHYKSSHKYMCYLTEAIGDMYWELNQKDNALVFYNRSVEGKKNKLNPRLNTIHQADSLAGSSHYTKALDIYADALKFRQGLYGEKHPMTGSCQNQIARAYLSKKEYDAALEAYQVALTMLVKDFNDTTANINPSSEMQVLSERYLIESMYGKTLVLQKIYQQRKKKKDLILAFETSMETILLLEKFRQSPLAESSKSFWTRKYFSLFDIALELAYERYGTGKEFIAIAFPIIESSKAFLLQNALRFSEKSTFVDIPSTLLEEERGLKKTIRQYLLRIEQEERLCEKAQIQKLELWNRELFDLKLEYNLFIENLKNHHPKYYQLKYEHQTLPLQTIKDQILANDQSLLIEYFEGKDYIFALAFSYQKSFGWRFDKDSVFSQQLNDFTTAFYDISGALERPADYYDQFSKNARRLYQQLLAPAFDHFSDSVEQVFIIPDKGLFYLPFECLLDGEQPKERDYRQLPYLLQRYRFSYSQSADILARSFTSRNPRKFKYNYLGFAPDHFQDKQQALPPLHWNKKEIETAGKLWKGKTLITTEATRESFLRHVNDGRIQHFATHAIIDNENPMLSRIIFQGDSNNVIYTSDLYSLPIQSDLVILNACNTARGKWQQGEGMISLESVFQYTGCRSILTSTWSLDDKASSQLTIDFLTFLKNGYPKNKALAAAKRKYLREADPAFAHPYYWAGLRLTGNIAPVEVAANWWPIFLGAFLFLVFVLGANHIRNLRAYK